MEVLVALVIFAIVVVASSRVFIQVLDVTKRSEENTEAILRFEDLIYQLETGERSDLLYYGGRGQLEGFAYEIKSQVVKEEMKDQGQTLKEEATNEVFMTYLLDTHLSWKEGKRFLVQDLLLSEGRGL